MSKHLNKVRHTFLRLATHPEITTPDPAYDRDVAGILAMLEAKAPETEIIRKYAGAASPLNLDAARTYLGHQARLAAGTTLPRIFMLDENLPAEIVLDVGRLFGLSSHVSTEYPSLKRTDDRIIWNHMIENGYKAILTADHDFKQIAVEQRRLHPDVVPPAVILIDKDKIQGDQIKGLVNLLQDHYLDIIEFVARNDVPWVKLERGGFKTARPGCTLQPYRPGMKL